jgi:SAM-dependent methyltransferase
MDEIEIVNKTSRSRGAVGENAITPRYVRDIATRKDNILDYGAGKDIRHTLDLRSWGLDVTAYDIGKNVQPGRHDPYALVRQYSVVYASNVINVAPSVSFLRKTLSEIRGALKIGGRAIFNYPGDPRKAGLTTKQMEDIVREYFPDLRRVGGTPSDPLWEGRAVESLTEKDLFTGKQPVKNHAARKPTGEREQVDYPHGLSGIQ